MQRDSYQQSGAEQLAVGLGWFSIGLGLAELTAPDAVARFIGLRDDSTTTSVLRAYGAREVGNGLAILMQPGNPTWLWSRVGGDALDLASLASAARHEVVDRERVGVAAAAVLGVAALDVICARQLSAGGEQRDQRLASRSQAVHVERVTTVSRPIEDVYQFWKNFENFPRFMRHLESVQVTGDSRSRWCATGPAGMRVEWEAETFATTKTSGSRGDRSRDPTSRTAVRCASRGRRARAARSSRATAVHTPQAAPSDAASPGCSAKSRTSRSTKTCTGSSS